MFVLRSTLVAAGAAAMLMSGAGVAAAEGFADAMPEVQLVRAQTSDEKTKALVAQAQTRANSAAARIRNAAYRAALQNYASDPDQSDIETKAAAAADSNDTVKYTAAVAAEAATVTATKDATAKAAEIAKHAVNAMLWVPSPARAVCGKEAAIARDTAIAAADAPDDVDRADAATAAEVKAVEGLKSSCRLFELR